VVVDFDGDAQNEIGVFTKQDEQLTIVSLDGVVERRIVVGQGYGPMRLANIDLGYGEEIVVYPLVRDGVTTIGVIRDVVLIRRLNASLTYSPSVISQGDTLYVSVDVTNIYSETISDAEVYLTIHYLSGTTIINQTKALIFEASHYSTSIAINWPIGIVSFSLVVNHELYDVWEQYYPNALVVRTTLDVAVYTKEIVMQNSTFSANITVADSLGARVPDATVSVSLGGTDHAATYFNTQYRLSIPNIDLAPGAYLVNVSVNHVFAEHIASVLASFRLLTDEIHIDKNMPAVLEQDQRFTGWLNISDMFGNPMHGAHVMMTSGNHQLTLEEMAIGCYFLDTTATLNVGNHDFEVSVDHEFIQGMIFDHVQIEVLGDLIAEVPPIPPVNGGDLFNITVFINDIYGPAPSDAWVIIEIDGKNVTAAQLSIGRYRAELNATFAAGDWKFTVYYGSGFSHGGKKEYDLRVYSDAAVIISSSDGWTVGQSNSTMVEVHVEDWLHTPIEDAMVNLLVRGTTYTLGHVGDGVYRRQISTVGWPYGVHTYYIVVNGEYLYQAQISGNLTVIAKPSITIRPSSSSPAQFDSLVVTVEVKDLYKNPVTNLQVVVTLSDHTLVAEEVGIGVYSATINLENIHHGWWNISVFLEGNLSARASSQYPIYVNVFVPGLDALGVSEVSFAAGLSLLISLIGMVLFVKVSSVVTTAPSRGDDVSRSISHLDGIYGIVVVASGALFLHSWVLYTDGAYIYALIESVILLGASVLLYGLWLYRDAYSSILLRGRIDRRRVALGMWHLFLVPFIVFLIFLYGEPLEAFEQYIMEVQHIVVGDISIVPLQATVLATYLSSIVVVVFSFYREIRKGLNRISSMIASGTPKNVVDEEQALLIGRTGSSIRIKFLMFLLILGATTVMQLDFLKNYSMVAIVLIPIVFLVLIPFASSRIVRSIPGMTKRPVRDDEENYDETTEPGVR
jgi:hypothetical protein